VGIALEIVLYSIKFIVLGISLAAPVGPINIEMIKRGISGGFWQSWLVGLGGVSADLVYLIVIFFGVGQMMKHPIVVICMYAVGACMLVMIGINSMKASVQKQVISEGEHRPDLGKNSFLTGFLIAIINPINLVFWFGVYGSTLTDLTSKLSLHWALFYSATIFVGIILWNLNIAFTVHFARELVSERVLKAVTFVAGIILIWFGISFAIEFVKALT
jgi:threonine/homoserine/homoserine lactone efflux protein